MRPTTTLRLAAALLAAGLIPIGPTRARADGPGPGAEGDRMAAIVAAVRAEEAKFRDLEYALRITTRKVDPKAPERPGEVTSEESRRVVLQGDRVWFRAESSGRAFKTERRREEVSAFDGERTRTVFAGNSVNIHLGRFEHPDVYPAHCIPLIHYKLNFPLSVYLAGTEAIHAHPKYGHFVRESGSIYEFTRVVARFEGEEVVDGLRCARVRCERRYYSKDVPVVQDLWLAIDRNYQCIKERQSRPGSRGGDRPRDVMHVDELREVAPGLWFPMKVTAAGASTVVESVSLDPHHDPAFFRDVAIPSDLPVFTIKDGALAGSALPEPVGGDQEGAKLAAVIAKVRENEAKYAEIEVKVRVDYRHVGVDLFMEGIITEQSRSERSVLREPLAYFASGGGYATAGGDRSEDAEVQAFDGQWTRDFRLSKQQGQAPQRWASLRKGGMVKAEGRHDGIPVFRPHTFLVRDDWIYGPFTDLLESPWHDKRNKYRLRFRYCGEEEIDGHPCVKLRGEVTTREGEPPSGFMAFWLASDRNYTPIKLEHYGGNHGLRPIPGGISRCDDFREIAPGVWYPFRTTQVEFNGWIDLVQGRITIGWRRVYTVESAELSPAADDTLFHEVVVPPGTEVQVSDESGNFVGQFDQEKEGVPEITPARYLALQSEAKVRDEEQKARQKAIDALIGKPAPEFPEGATWLNGEPLAWKDLRGKVVVLDFWAEWCGPCRNDFPQLVLSHDAREANGLTVIGVHPPGSEPEAIAKVMDEFRLKYPTCVDVPPAPGIDAWGQMFGRLAVRAIPHAVAVDGDGTIVACGRLRDVLAKAHAAVKPR